MDLVTVALLIATLFVGYAIGVLVAGRLSVERGGDGGEPPDDGEPIVPKPDDFALWERELVRERPLVPAGS